MFAKFTPVLIAFSLAALTTSAQSPPPIIVQAVVPAGNPAVNPAPAGQPATADDAAAIKALQGLKATNEEILRKQALTLQQLDEMEKAADQIKIYTKRG